MTGKLRFTDKDALFNAIAHMIGASWSRGMQYPYVRPLKEKWTHEIGSCFTEDGEYELVTYEDALQAIENGEV